ncbi:TPR repeat-containing protein [Glycocaulis alkaliphilus]|uniref:TPR repeat-containing protein n=2 Tax=Glycocaulis alkaliphilus TaxID=1434191 RepID=A0A3T0ECS4_9PROT|nr:TPR repeat-containing protein [Glycocaulis alkaliphilus]
MMWSVFVLATALGSQTPDPYAALDGDAAAICANAERAMEAGRHNEAAAGFQMCEQATRRGLDLERGELWALQAHISRRLAAARQADGDATGAANATYMADRYEQLMGQLADLTRQSQARTLFQEGRYAEAEAISLVLLAEAEAGEHRVGAVHDRLYSLASALLPQGRAEEAIPLLERAVDEARRSGEGGEPEVYLNMLAEAYFDTARFSESAAILRDLYDRSGGAARSTYGNNLARALDGAGLHAEAEALLRSAVSDARADDGGVASNPHRLARVLFNLARNLAAQGRHEDAASLFAESAALTVQRRPAGHTDIIAAHTWLVGHTLANTHDAQTALSGARILSANLDRYLASGGEDADRQRAIQNAGEPQALFTLHTEAAWAAAHNEG